MRVGLISDTHGLLRPEAVAFLDGCDHIIHAGDIDRPNVLEDLAKIAPLTVVRGNNDKGAWANTIPATALVEFGNRLIYVIHDISMLHLDPQAAKIDVVIYGHSHKPLIERRGDVLFVNPGSAGPRRFKLPITVAELRITGQAVKPKIKELKLPR